MKKLVIALLILAALAFIALGIYYMMTPAGSLPHALPGYEAGSSHKHMKHGLAAFAVAVACAIVAWFMTGKKSGNGSSSPAAPSAPQSTE
ncbi:MAG TPA: hypothetical protein VF466_00620 [Candidatus Saccharimonadales bacterium]